MRTITTTAKMSYAVAALGLAGATMIGAAAPAQAAAKGNGKCEAGEFCLYYGKGATGSVADGVGTTRAYGGTGSGCITFAGAGAGRGKCVKNNAASVHNRSNKQATVFYNSDFGSTYDVIPAGKKVNLNANVNKDNGSQILGDASLRFPLAVKSQAPVKNNKPAWCWNSKANCHHDYNAADIFVKVGTPVVSPVAGTVKTVRSRTSGVGSSVTVKDGFGRLWYFAHMHHNPGPAVKVGQKVNKGTKIGVVGTKDHAMGTPPHLHLDMRVGVDSRVDCSGAACSKYGFVNNQPLLRNSFLALPAK